MNLLCPRLTKTFRCFRVSSPAFCFQRNISDNILMFRREKFSASNSFFCGKRGIIIEQNDPQTSFTTRLGAYYRVVHVLNYQ
jgi:hypothetical protein